MSAMHTPEPWPAWDGTLIVVLGAEDYKRARVCVDACTGMDDPAAEIGAMRDKLLDAAVEHAALADRAKEFCAQHDELLAVLSRIAAPHDCGCRPCTGQCLSEESLRIIVASMRDEARSAIAKVQP